jgi:hypothetical protein
MMESFHDELTDELAAWLVRHVVPDRLRRILDDTHTEGETSSRNKPRGLITIDDEIRILGNSIADEKTRSLFGILHGCMMAGCVSIYDVEQRARNLLDAPIAS